MSEFNYTEWMQRNKVGPYEKYSLRENGIGDMPDNSKLPGNPKLQAAVKYLVQNRDKYITQDYFSKHSISFLSSKSDKELYDYIISKMHSDDVYDTVANMRSQIDGEGSGLGQNIKEGGPGDEPPTTFPEDDYDDKRDLDEMGNIKDIKIEIPGNSSAVDFGKAAARELVESFGARDFKYFLQAFTQEISKLTSR